MRPQSRGHGAAVGELSLVPGLVWCQVRKMSSVGKKLNKNLKFVELIFFFFSDSGRK